jgi:uncharacterized protein (TIGR03086 family)
VSGPGAEPQDLLESAIDYALSNVFGLDEYVLCWPTPCPQWNVRRLLGHLAASLRALTDVLGRSAVRVAPCDASDPVAAVAAEAELLLRNARRRDLSTAHVGDLRLPTRLVLGAGALEIAVHGWDVGRARRAPRPMPSGVASTLLGMAPALVTRADRSGLFGAPVRVPLDASPSDRLLAFVGRDPNASAPALRSSGSSPNR